MSACKTYTSHCYGAATSQRQGHLACTATCVATCIAAGSPCDQAAGTTVQLAIASHSRAQAQKRQHTCQPRLMLSIACMRGHRLEVTYVTPSLRMCACMSGYVRSPYTNLEAVFVSHRLGQCFDLLDKGLGAFLHDISPDVCPQCLAPNLHWSYRKQPGQECAEDTCQVTCKDYQEQR